jgi:pectinesterase
MHRKWLAKAQSPPYEGGDYTRPAHLVHLDSLAIKITLFFVMTLAFAPLLCAQRPAADAVVAPDGSGDYKTVQEAINAVPQTTSESHRWVIFIKPGTYREIVYIQREKRFVSLVGEDPLRTVITYNLNANNIGSDGKPIGTFRTPSFFVDADDFTAENITFENSAGPVGQALALRVDGDRAVFRNCRFLGWQDTILLNRGRHYFEDSLITGHVDFIFGAATAFFERCHIHAWRNGYITAASTPGEQRYGFVFSGGKITGESADVRTYLGRPWRDFAQVTFLNTEMSEVVRPVGWNNWDRPEREKTSRFSEFGSTGPGAKASDRAPWAKPFSAGDAAGTSVTAVLGGPDRWDPRRIPAHPSATKVSAAPMPAAPGGAVESAGQVILLWPEGVPGGKANAEPERIVDARVSNVQVPTITYYPASPAISVGTAVIICPGGGYARLAFDKEGTDVAKRLNAIGISAFVLKYRLSEYGHPAPLQDVLRSIRLVRSRSMEFGIKADRIGVMGFSAGGHVAATAATLFDASAGRTGSQLDRTSARPDFAALIYPVITMKDPFAHKGSRENLLGKNASVALVDELSVELHVASNTPPVFLVHTEEDTTVPVENSIAFYQALRKATVPAELHLYAKGPHGFALADGLGPASEWPRRLEEWMRSHGWLDK